jgi:hypothetical protein
MAGKQSIKPLCLVNLGLADKKAISRGNRGAKRAESRSMSSSQFAAAKEPCPHEMIEGYNFRGPITALCMSL